MNVALIGPIIYAARMADHWHQGQVRDHKRVPYTAHLARVAGRVILHPDATQDMVCAAWLHDVLEDQGTTSERRTQIGREILVNLSDRVLNIVIGLTNTSKNTGLPRKTRKQMDRERIAAQPRAVKIIKLIDRIDNVTESIQDMRMGLDTAFGFNRLYATESLLLLNEALQGTDHKLEAELLEAVAELTLAAANTGLRKT